MKSLTETMLGAALGILLTAGLVEFSLATLWAADKTFTADTLTRAGRAGLDEILYQTRGASAVLGQTTLNASAVRSSSSTLVLESPSYDVDTSDFRIAGQYDTIVFAYDSPSHTVQETIVRGNGTDRPSRTDFVIARNVAHFNISYRVRDTFTAPASGSTTAYTLSQTPTTGAPLTILVDGVPATGTLSGAAVTLAGAAPGAGANVQISYPVTPTSGGANPAAGASGVTVTMEMSTAGGKRSSTQSWAIEGSARLRNLRQ